MVVFSIIRNYVIISEMITKLKQVVPESWKRIFHIAQWLLFSVIKGCPNRGVKIIGVTGTSGKSTTAAMIHHILQTTGHKTGLISTVGASIGTETMSTGLHVTTPDPKDLPELFSKMRQGGVKYVVLECSSHALAQGRLGLIKLDVAVFTNIKKDHLDWHKDWESYVEAKSRLIDILHKSGTVILNKDDKPAHKYLSERLSEDPTENKLPVAHYTIDEANGLIQDNKSISFEYSGVGFTVPILGTYNVENLLAACMAAKALSVSVQESAAALESFKGIKGRMQVLKNKPYTVIVDFAHNTNSLEKSLQSAQNLLGSSGNLISVFGSAGVRDVEKRADMGRISGKYAEITIVTAEDPRTEALKAINTEIIDGAESSGAQLIARFKNSGEYVSNRERYLGNMTTTKQVFAFDEESVASRFDAIDFAIRLAKPGDLVITQGKGHEESLCFGKIEYPFTDQQAVKKALKANSIS